jgi:hypothetical protein
MITEHKDEKMLISSYSANVRYCTLILRRERERERERLRENMYL